MINFRFHLVSLIAVFLALALGVVVGSTVIDRAIVDGLEAQIDRVERNAEAQRRENGELRARLERFETFADQVAAFATADRLADVPLLVIAVRGIDEDGVRSTAAALRDAGGALPAVLWLEPAWALPSQEDRERLRQVVGLHDAAPAALRSRTLALLADHLASQSAQPPSGDAAGEAAGGEAEGTSTTAPPTSTTTTQAATTTAPDRTAAASADDREAADVLVDLIEGGFLSVDTAGGEDVEVAALAAPGLRIVALSGSAGRVSSETLFLPLVRALESRDLGIVAAEIPAPDDEGKALVVREVRSDDGLAQRVPTVDGLDTVRGRVALVLALSQLGDGTVGHYGTGHGASRQLPEAFTD